MKAPHPTTLCERILNRIFPHKIIQNCDGDPYLLRWYVFKSDRVSLFLHKFIRSDEDRALHDHPWSFLVIPIWRGYVEHSDRAPTLAEIYEDAGHRGGPRFYAFSQVLDFQEDTRNARPTSRRVYPLISSRYRPATYRHRVELIDGKPSWSVFFHFSREREWGFHPRDGFIDWKKWAKDHKCE